jgi:hypothetical protein
MKGQKDDFVVSDASISPSAFSLKALLRPAGSEKLLQQVGAFCC